MEEKERRRLAERVVRAAETLLAEQHYVSVLDVFAAVGWLQQARLDEWRQGRLEALEAGLQLRPDKVTAAVNILSRWALERGLRQHDVGFRARTRDRRELRFTVSGEPDGERSFRRHFVSPELSEGKWERIAERLSAPPELVVISPLREWTCAKCGESSFHDLMLLEESEPLCMKCAALDHLVYLRRGDAALTRRAKEASGEVAVVVRWSRARKRYERQGILVEEEALTRAERELGRTPSEGLPE